MSHSRTNIISIFLLALASLSPFAYLLMYPDGYPYDIYTFLSWKDCLKEYANQPIFPCTPKTINYPTIGLYASTGVFLALEALGSSRNDIEMHFRLVLGAVDIFNVIVMYLLLSGLGIRRAAFATLLFSFLPSTRLGASLWGQVDTVSQLFLSLAFLFGLRGFRSIERNKLDKALRYFAGLSFACILACLTKQLVAFSLPGLVVLWGVLFSKLLGTPLRRKTLIIVTLIPIVACGIDQLFPAPHGYFGSGMLYVLSTGSSHGSEITANGTNLFSLLPVDPSSPSTASYHLFSLLGHDISGIPFIIGTVSATVLVLLGAALTWRLAALSGPLSARATTLHILGFTAFCNLALNVTLTGIHERYLFHYAFFAYPVLLSLLPRSRAYVILMCVVGAQLFAYGCFLLIRIDTGISERTAYYAHLSSVLGNLTVLLFSLALALLAALPKLRRHSK
jgi:hypothetical protein